MTVINLSELREEKMPHTSGVAVCLNCKHEWVAVAPHVGEVLWLECPSCGLIRGRFKYHHERSGEHWTCNCGSELFYIKAGVPYCPNCGAWQQGY